MDSALIGEALIGLSLKSGDLATQFGAEMKAMNAEADAGSSKLSKILGGGFGIVAKAVAGIAVAAIGVAAATADMASKFQRAMNLLQTEAGYSAADVKTLSAAVLNLAPQVGKGPDELAAGLYHIASAGIPASKAMDALTASAKLSAIGNSDMEASTQAVLGVMAAYPQYMGNATASVGILNAIVGSGDMRMQGLAKAMATGILPAAQNVKLGLVDVGAALATLTDNVTPPDEAATRLRMTFALLEHQSHPAAAALESIGIKSHQLGEDMVKPNGLLVAITDLRTHLTQTFGAQAVDDLNHYVSIMQTQGVDAANKYAAATAGAASVVQTAFGGGRTSAAIETLLGEYDKFHGKYDQINKGAADFQHSWEVTTKNVDFQFKSLEAGLQSLGIKIGTALLPYVSQLLGYIAGNVVPALNRFADWFIRNGIPAVQQFGTATVGVFHTLSGPIGDVAHALGTALSPLKKVVDALGGWGPILVSVVSGLAALKAALTIVDVVQSLTSAVKILAGAFNLLATGAAYATTATDALAISEVAAAAPFLLLAVVVAAVTWAVIEMYQHWDAFKNYMSGSFMGAMHAVAGFFEGFASYISGSFMTAVNAVGGFFSTLGRDISGAFGGAVGAVWQTLKDFAAYISSTFMDAVNSAVGFVESVPGAMGRAIAAIPGAIGALGDFLRRLFFEQIPYAVGFVVGYVPSKLAELSNRMITWAFSTGARFGAWIDALPGRIRAALDRAIIAVVDWGGRMAAQAILIAGQFLSNIGTFIDQLPGRIGGALATAYNAVVSWGGNLISTAGRIGAQVVNAIVDFVEKLPGRVGGFLASVIGAVARWGSEMTSSGWQAATNFVNSVWNVVSGLPARFGQLAQDVVNGFVQGMKNLAGNVTSAVSSFFTGVVDGAKSAIGAHSASTVFAEQVGAPIAQGVALGIRQHLGAAQEALNGIGALRPSGTSTTGIAAAVAGALPGTAGSAAGVSTLADLLQRQNDLLTQNNTLLARILASDGGVSTLGASMRVA